MPQSETSDSMTAASCNVFVYPCKVGAPICMTQREWMMLYAPLHGTLLAVALDAVVFELETNLDVGGTAVIRIEHPQRRHFVDVLGRVERTSRLERGRFRVVCRLNAELAGEQIASLGQEPFASELV